MFELNNEQRKCFALQPVLDAWERVELKPSPYDKHKTYAYLDGLRVVKMILVCDIPGWELYYECTVDEALSDDKTKLLPKTQKGKPQNFTSSNLEKRTRRGMALSYCRYIITLFSFDTEQDFYSSYYEGTEINCFEDFKGWVDDWCRATGEKELAEINAFASKTRVHRKFKEGDFFRYRINRWLYGYGRIILDINKMRKDGIKFWDIFMGKPLYVAVYHIATEDKNLMPEQLVDLKMLPSQLIMDNIFYYGECEIIGNLPLKEEEKDYPIHYGLSIRAGERNRVVYQRGTTYISVVDANAPVPRYHFNGVGFSLNISLPILLECIRTNSNDPYWEKGLPGCIEKDLRNPKLKNTLTEVERYFKLSR